jgi:hypothetical protein
MIPVLIAQAECSLTQCLELPWTTDSRLWNGTKAPYDFKYQIILGPQSLTFLACVPIHAHQLNLHPKDTKDDIAGTFKESLAEADVGELFISENHGPGYLEIHVSPKGSWWLCAFEKSRVRSATQFSVNEEQNNSQTKVETIAKIGEHSWQAGVKIPVSLLAENPIGKRLIAANLAAFQMSATACVGKGERLFYSAARATGEKPDFHQPQNFLELLPLRLSF